jgi:flavin-dependent dehydrogenase
MTLPAKTDILVVGGGPAGSMAATELARRGHEVTLVDKQHHPRETVGESVLPSAWKYFDMLGVSDEVQKRFVRKAGGVVDWGEQLTQISFRDFSYTRPGLHVERDELDLLLLDTAREAGATVHEGIRADRFDARDDAAGTLHVTLPDGARQAIDCRMMIDATGQGCLTARQYDARRVNPDFRFVALWGYWKDSLYVGAGGVVLPFAKVREIPPMTFVTRLGGWGWSWHIPLKQHTSVGLIIPVDQFKAESAQHPSLEAYFEAVCRRTGHLAKLVEGATLTNGGVRMMRDFSYVSEAVSGPGFLVAGDAAGFVDPIFSIGYVMALYSGHLSAWAAERVLRAPAQAALTRRLFDAQMRGRYELAHTMALPGVETDAPDGARRYFDFFSKSEKALMWSAASMTTRSGNLVRTSGESGPEALRRTELAGLTYA